MRVKRKILFREIQTSYDYSDVVCVAARQWLGKKIKLIYSVKNKNDLCTAGVGVRSFRGRRRSISRARGTGGRNIVSTKTAECRRDDVITAGASAAIVRKGTVSKAPPVAATYAVRLFTCDSYCPASNARLLSNADLT